MANGIDDPRFMPFERASPATGFTSGESQSGTSRTGFRQRMIDRAFANEVRNIASNRRLGGSRREAALALAKARRDAPRAPGSVNRPVVTESMRLLQDAIRAPIGQGRRARVLTAGAAELAGRSDLAEDLTFSGLRRGTVRFPRDGGRRGRRTASSRLEEAAEQLRSIQGAAPRLGQRVSPTNQVNPVDIEDDVDDEFDDDTLDLIRPTASVFGRGF